MSVASPGQTSYSGSVFYYDTFNIKSYIGEPTINLIPSPTYNAYPTYGNGWGTYNTNQYNGGAYFSIGTVSDVTSNIVTMTGAHPLRSYDVVIPQTTGGGVNTSTNYLVKKISTTQFSLHSYNGSQDGSQGYINPATGNHKVYDDFANDVRISINSTSFPTMWWGQPHVPNSGLVKEIIPNGCNIDPTKLTDCIRLHYIRSDAFDGMAYGVVAPVDIGGTYTVSFWTRAVNANAVGQNVAYQIYNYGGIGGADEYGLNKALGPLGVWQRHEMTFVPTHTICISYWFIGGGPCAYDIANIQFEKKAHATPFTVGTRSAAQGLLDLSRNYVTDLSYMLYNSAAIPYFDNSTTRLPIYGLSDTFWADGSWTVTVWVKFNAINKGSDNAIISHGYSGTNNGLHLGERSGYVYFGFHGNDTAGTIPLSAGPWYNIVFTYNYTTKLKQIYVNGGFDTSGGTVGYTGLSGDSEVGRYLWATSHVMYGSIASVLLNRRVLTAPEVLQNFNVHKRRYGL